MINEDTVAQEAIVPASAVEAKVGSRVDDGIGAKAGASKKASKSKRPKSVWKGEPAKNITVEQYSSTIRRPKIQAVQVRSLGLGRIGKRKVLPAIPPIVALVEKLKHLVRVVEKD
jgi:large subunit ribosomal protein L30